VECVNRSEKARQAVRRLNNKVNNFMLRLINMQLSSSVQFLLGWRMTHAKTQGFHAKDLKLFCKN